ncbi:NADP-dependent malic enzyme [Bacteroides pyogenes JCM 10003]|nr:NADP-dependent malic enzyme [Bacteroides pyogenes JCM 10003]
MAKITKEAALLYHSQGKPGKIEVVPTKPHSTQNDLSLAYSPGVQNLASKLKKIRRTLINIRRKEIW